MMTTKYPNPPREIAIDEWPWKKEKDPRFHRLEYSKNLTKFYDQLFDKNTGRVFVPLCGKTLDMIYLADRGNEVVGLEFSKIGIECFFNENNLTYTKTEIDHFTIYEAKEKNVTIFCGDLFEFNVNISGIFDAVWDRGSYVAVNISQQKQYADLMQTLMKPNAKILIEATTYDTARYKLGPPYYVDGDNLQANFGKNFDIELLRTFIDKPRYFPSRLQLDVSVYLLTLK